MISVSNSDLGLCPGASGLFSNAMAKTPVGPASAFADLKGATGAIPWLVTWDTHWDKHRSGYKSEVPQLGQAVAIWTWLNYHHVDSVWSSEIGTLRWDKTDFKGGLRRVGLSLASMENCVRPRSELESWVDFAKEIRGTTIAVQHVHRYRLLLYYILLLSSNYADVEKWFLIEFPWFLQVWYSRYTKFGPRDCGTCSHFWPPGSLSSPGPLLPWKLRAASLWWSLGSGGGFCPKFLVDDVFI